MNDKHKLTPKRKRFIEYYLQSYNATEAYQKTYHVKCSTARRNGHRLLTNADIQSKISNIRKQQSNELHCNRLDVLRRLIGMFFTDVKDYVHFGSHPATDKNGNHYRRSYLYFKDSDDIDTRFIQSVTQGKDGNRIELPNKLQLGALLLQYLPSPPNTDIRKDSLVIAFENAIKNSDKSKKG